NEGHTCDRLQIERTVSLRAKGLTMQQTMVRAGAVFLLVLGLCIVASLVGASDQQATVAQAATAVSALLGKWEATDRPWHIEFATSGVIRMSTIGPVRIGTYRLDTDGTLWVQMADGQKLKANVKLVNQDKLVLTDPDGSFTSFRRVE